MVSELMDECNTIQFMQWLQSRPYMLVERCEEFLDVRIVRIASFHIHNNPVVVSAFHFMNNWVDEALIGRSFSDVVRLLSGCPRSRCTIGFHRDGQISHTSFAMDKLHD